MFVPSTQSTLCAPHPQLSTPFNTSTFVPSTQSTLCAPHPQLATWHSLQHSPLYSTQTHPGPLLVPWHDLDFMSVTFDLDFALVRYWLRLCLSHNLDIDSPVMDFASLIGSLWTTLVPRSDSPIKVHVSPVVDFALSIRSLWTIPVPRNDSQPLQIHLNWHISVSHI